MLTPTRLARVAIEWPVRRRFLVLERRPASPSGGKPESGGDTPIAWETLSGDDLVEMCRVQLTWQPQPGDCLIFDVFTHAEARGRHLFAALSERGAFAVRSLGFDRCVAFIAWWNESALRRAARFEYTVTGSVTLWSFGRWRTHTASGSAQLGAGTVRVRR